MREGREREERTNDRKNNSTRREGEGAIETKGPLKLDLASDSDKWEDVVGDDENADDNELIL